MMCGSKIRITSYQNKFNELLHSRKMFCAFLPLPSSFFAHYQLHRGCSYKNEYRSNDRFAQFNTSIGRTKFFLCNLPCEKSLYQQSLAVPLIDDNW